MADAVLFGPGLGDLALALFNSESSASPEEILTRWAAVQNSMISSEYARDARVLLQSPLTADDLAFLWCVCSDSGYQPPRDGVTGRRWTETVYAVFARHGEQSAIDQTLRGSDDPALISRVRDLISQFSVNGMYASAVGSCFGNVAEVKRILTELTGVAPDLAFRLFVSLASNFHMELTSELRAELKAVSLRLMHPDDALDRLQDGS